MLFETYKTCYGDCVGDRTINKLSLLIVMFESSEMFEQIAENLKGKLILDIDRDVDYQLWGKPETWIAKKSKNAQPASTMTYESLNMGKGATFVNHMTSMLPQHLKFPQTRKRIKRTLWDSPIRRETSSKPLSTI